MQQQDYYHEIFTQKDSNKDNPAFNRDIQEQITMNQQNQYQQQQQIPTFNQPIQMQPQANYIIVQQPNLNNTQYQILSQLQLFHSKDPVSYKCPICQQLNLTMVEYQPCNLYTILWFFCCVPINWTCFIPGLCKQQQDAIHICPNCKYQLARNNGSCV
eukprot:TRINITY_DN835_c0_g1_i11.p1 TRINITY_DN835_c0_g1~~TRINITY_DN835_c0_g1_i11.p1  ORF type:complete len:158 (+),score=16.63 TRINITY_DN835_c0_g1_i11:94-567(+)